MPKGIRYVCVDCGRRVSDPDFRRGWCPFCRSFTHIYPDDTGFGAEFEERRRRNTEVGDRGNIEEGEHT